MGEFGDVGADRTSRTPGPTTPAPAVEQCAMEQPLAHPAPAIEQCAMEQALARAAAAMAKARALRVSREVVVEEYEKTMAYRASTHRVYKETVAGAAAVRTEAEAVLRREIRGLARQFRSRGDGPERMLATLKPLVFAAASAAAGEHVGNEVVAASVRLSIEEYYAAA